MNARIGLHDFIFPSCYSLRDLEGSFANAIPPERPRGADFPEGMTTGPIPMFLSVCPET